MKVLTEKKSEDISVIGTEPVPVISDGSEIAGREPGPLLALPGGGKRVRFPNGAEMVCGGALLRQALLNGAEIVGEVPVPVKRAPSIEAQRAQMSRECGRLHK